MQAEKNAISYIDEKYGFNADITNSEVESEGGLFGSTFTGYAFIEMEHDEKRFTVYIDGKTVNQDGRDNYQEEQIQEAFCFIDGNIISFDKNVNGVESVSREHGTKTKEMRESIIRAVTDNENSYTIYVSENLIYSKDPKREGITEIIIENNDDESQTIIGYSWQDLYTEGKQIAYESSKALGESDDSAFSNLLSDALAESNETQNNINKAMDFFEGMPYFGDVNGDGLYYGKHNIDVTVYEEETVENGEPVCIKLKINCKNIETDADRIFTSEIEAYIQNDENPELIGITKFILFDEDKNSIIIE